MPSQNDITVIGAGAFVAREPGPSKEPLTPAKWATQPARLARMDRLCALALVATDAALLDAGLSDVSGERTAIVLGTAFGCHATNEEYYRGLLKEGPAGASPRLFAYTLPSSPVGEISIHYGIRGPATTAAPGLHAGLAAIAEGITHLEQDRADRVIVVAAEVASALLGELLGHAVRDAAAAVILERGRHGRARVISVEESFPGAGAVSDDTLAVTPLLSLIRWLAEAHGRLELVAADPEGGAARLVAEI
jgi:3-oxoacyl-[acyl-carrier-protein] synthase II